MTTRAANLLGALSLVITDRLGDATTGAAGQSATAATALSALYHFLDRPSIDLLRQVLGLTSAGTVRLVDRLRDAGYVRRAPGKDGRASHIVLTGEGRRAAAGVSKARADALEQALSALTAEERQHYEELTAKLVAGLVRKPGATRWMCRLCDTTGCGRDAGNCPAANAARAAASRASTASAAARDKRA